MSAIGWFWGPNKVQKEVKSKQKQPSCKKNGVVTLNMDEEFKVVKSKVVAKK